MVFELFYRKKHKQTNKFVFFYLFQTNLFFNFVRHFVNKCVITYFKIIMFNGFVRDLSGIGWLIYKKTKK